MSEIISFSGIDSAGKSTQIEKVKNIYEKRQRKYKVIWSRGGYTSIFEFLKKIIRFIGKTKLPEPGRNQKREVMFKNRFISRIWYVIAMLDLIRLYALTFRIYKMLGYDIIADRYLWDTYVDFNMSLPEIDLSRSFLWKTAVTLTPKINKSIILYISPETSYARSIDKNEPFFDDMKTRRNRINQYSKLIESKKWNYVIDTENNNAADTFTIIEDIFNGIQ